MERDRTFTAGRTKAAAIAKTLDPRIVTPTCGANPRPIRTDPHMKNPSISKRGLRLAATLGVVVGVAVAVSGCGSSVGTDASGGGSGTTTTDGQYVAMLDELYKGTYQEPNGPVIAEPAAGKNIWVMPAGLNGEVMVDAVDGVKEAATKLGWDVTVFDGKFSPTTQLAGVQQALAAGADGIITVYVDCPAIKNGLAQAKQAKVPTINLAGEECDPPAFAYTVAYPGFENYIDYLTAYGQAQAYYAIAKTDGQAKVIMSTQTDLGSIREMSQGVRNALAKCTGCEIRADAEFVGADFGPPLQSKISQQFLKHPDANVFIAPYDAILTAGGTQALKSSSRLDQTLVVAGEGSVEGIESIRSDSGIDACLGYDAGMEGYGGVNYLVIHFDGKDPSKVHNGIGWQACDKDHNLPAAGANFESPIDYRAAYERLWSLR
ncbi:sugar ABC transporter substrate-binding protein [Paenarthrobacter sp. NEAU-H11]|uniref:sugar ABC transporter substrate-binding protein n=1 Tax=Paenarthrobacter sp. NEAU-H11 TaxID=3423924 RepID=UPI003D358F85